jgi:acetolactate decarboxylase
MKTVRRGVLLMVLCIHPWPAAAGEPDRGADTVHQVSTLGALLAGDYDGRARFRELRALGDFGLGTFDRLHGDMVAVDGRFFRVRTDGTTTRVRPNETTPFAVVTSFRPDQAFHLRGPLSCDALTEQIESRFASDERPQAIRVTGEFSLLETRSVPAQEEPYVPLEEALLGQVVFDFYHVDANMVGFWMPEVLDGVNAGGFHFHALTKDETAGGHVLACEALSVKVAIDQIDRLEVRFGSLGGHPRRSRQGSQVP